MNTENKLKIIQMNINWQKVNSYLFYIFLILYASLLFFLCYKLNIWEDEAYSLNTTINSLSKVINLSYYFENQPPGYFIILTLWRKINDGIFFARLLSVIFIFLSAFVLNKLLQLVFEHNYTKWGVILFLINPFTIWASQEIRLYALLILLTLLASYLFFLIYYYNTKTHKILFILICLLGVYTQYFFTFLIISFSLIILISKGLRSFLNFCLLCLPIALLFIPNLVFIKDQYSVNQDNIIEGYPLITRIKLVVSTFLEFFLAIGKIQKHKILWLISNSFIVFLFLNSLFKLYIKDPKNNNKDFKSIIEILAALILLLGIFTLIISTGGLIYNHKYLTIIFPLVCLLYASFNVYKKPIRNTIYLMFSIYFIILMSLKYQKPFVKDFNYPALSKFIQKNDNQKEPIIFYNKALAFTFNFYYKGNNLNNPLPEYISDRTYYDGFLTDTIGIIQSIKDATTLSESILLVTVALPEHADSILQIRYSSEYYLTKNYMNSFDTIIGGEYGDAKLRIRRLSKIGIRIP